MIEIFKQLAEPFAPEDVEWRVGNTNQKSVARQTGDPKARPTKGMMLPYVKNRAIMNRLDEVLGPENWTNSFKEHHVGTICTIGIRFNDEWIYKEDGADNTNIEPTKGGLSDSMKRAAVQFGIGRYLYNAETVWVDLDEWGRPKVTPKLTIKGTNNLIEVLDDIIERLGAVTSIEELTEVYKSLSPQMQKDEEIIAKCKEVKEGLEEIIK